MQRLPSIRCVCGRIIESDLYEPNSHGGAPRAAGYEVCLRRCEACGIGYSNASSPDPSKLQKLLRDPFVGLPEWISEGSDNALDQCLNQAAGHAAKKRRDFHSGASEDHATWVVFRTLQHYRLIGDSFNCPGRISSMLLWGVPSPSGCSDGKELRERLLQVLRVRLQEGEGWFTEPDVVLDFGEEGVVIVEAKLTSPNDWKDPSYRGWGKYLNDLAFRNQELAKQSGLYQLVRNWRVAFELAGARPFVVLNLAPGFDKSERRNLARFRASLRVAHHRFRLKTWDQLCMPLPKADWFDHYVEKRGLIVGSLRQRARSRTSPSEPTFTD